MAYSLIANSGIHITTFPLEIKTKEKFSLWFHEWYDTTNGEWILDLAHEVTTDTNRYFFKKKKLSEYGFLSEATGSGDIDVSSLADEGIIPLMIDEDMQCAGEIYKMSFSDKGNTLTFFENKWLPLPYFFKRSETKFKFGPLNWSRFMLIPIDSTEQYRRYNVVLAFDTRTVEQSSKYEECPIFPDQFMTEMKFEVCKQEFYLMDFCSPKQEWEYINDYLFSLVHPNISSVGKIKTGKRLSYIASYYLLIDYIAQNELFPKVSLFKDKDTLVKDVDMVIDIGNSRTTALLVEDNSNFNQVNLLELIDYTNLLKSDSNGTRINSYKEPFDMRLAFRKVDFGDFGIQGSKQFVYPSFVRLGKEANHLIHRATESVSNKESLSTMSSPKRYLWDGHKSKDEWNFMVLDGEKDNHILNIPGISEHLQSNGQLATNGTGGQSYHYSRRSLMTFAFLEMLVQAQVQINNNQYRIDRGDMTLPRRIRRMVVTCPTAMSKLEREALVKCANDAVKLLNLFKNEDYRVDIAPAITTFKDAESKWYYDEATCSQLVYIYGEIGWKYKGACQEFFNLYGKKAQNSIQPELTIGSLDIGAGTSDLMISRYSYTKGDVTTITPEPLFYDSFYYAGDEMLNELIRKIMFFSSNSAFRKKMKGISEMDYRQRMRNFFGPDYTGQTIADRKLRRDFNIQYSIPLMHYFLDMLANDIKDCTVRYSDVFEDCPPNERIKTGFKKYFSFDLEDLEWEFNKFVVSDVISRAFEPLLKKIATIMYAYNCDIVLLSGRPSSLSPIRNIFLKYYSVSPNRLILLNDYFVGHWYPNKNNTGKATAKTIVAMGALVGYYATSLGNLDKFLIDKSQLDKKLKSVINYIESSREGRPIEYFITPDKNMGELMVSSLPTTLNVRQIGLDSYPSRKLYVIDFNQHKMLERIRSKAIQDGTSINETQTLAKVKEIIDDLRLRMPFQLSIERDEDDKEKLIITAIVDKKGNELADSNIEINIQSLGADERYWLDTGAFDIQ